MTIEQAKTFLNNLCSELHPLVKGQVYEQCVGELNHVGYPSWDGKFGGRTASFVNDFTPITLTNHYKRILKEFE